MEGCVQNPLMPRVHRSRRAREIKWISFEDVIIYKLHSKWMKFSLAPTRQRIMYEWERNLYSYRFPPLMFIKDCQEQIRYYRNAYPESAGRERWARSHWPNTARHPEGTGLQSRHCSQAHNVHGGARAHGALQQHNCISQQNTAAANLEGELYGDNPQLTAWRIETPNYGSALLWWRLEDHKQVAVWLTTVWD